MGDKKTLTLGSLFDGSGGFPLGGLLSGITPVWAAEVEPFPIRVTTKRMPFMKHYGDVSVLDGGKVDPVDIITFGSPCQDMSIAGRRSGLDGSRSSLFYEAVRIIREMRSATNGRYPRFCVWENVPGAFSSNGGEDFRVVLQEIIQIKSPETQVPPPCEGGWPYADAYMGDGWSVAYRTLDAQYWGVPQRRKRIYLVADFAGGCAEKILFESEGLSGYSAESFRAWQRAAGYAAAGAGEAGERDILAFHINQREETIDLHGVSGALMATRNMQMQTFVAAPVQCLNDQGGARMDVTENISPTLLAETHGHLPCVVGSAGFCPEHSAKSRSIGYEEETSPTLRAGTVPAAVALYDNHGQDVRYNGPLDTAPTISTVYGTGGNNQPFVVGQTPKTLKVRSGCEGGGKGMLIQDDKSATLGCNNDQTVFVPKPYGISSFCSKAMMSDNPKAGIYEATSSKTLDCSGGAPTSHQGGIAIVEPERIYTITTGSFMQTTENRSPSLMARDYKDPTAVQCGYTVRRLTPTECARLQGFPDWWCSDLETTNPTKEELSFWTDVWETHRRVVSHSSRPKTEKQIRKWLSAPYSDSAEYKMWGNGVCLPCVIFVLSGIVYYSQFSN